MTTRRWTVWSALALVLFGAAAIGITTFSPDAGAAGDNGWFVSFERVFVPPVQRADVGQLVDAGTIRTDGFSELVFSIGGEFKENVPDSGTIGVVLIPDHEVFEHLLRSEGEFAFPLEIKTEIGRLQRAIFISDQQTAKVAFPAYRVYLYNETTSAARVSVFIYRTRF